MARIIEDLDDYIVYLNTLLNVSSSTPTAGDEDYIVWTSLANIAISIWEPEELWRELIVKLSDAADGDKTTTTATSYDLPTLFSFPVCGYVWLGTGTNKTPYKVIKPEEKQLYENNIDNWCYFLNGQLEFNPNLTITSGQTINYEFYKFATKLTTGSSVFEMSDPMFAVFYALSVLKAEEGDTTSAVIATQKLNAMQDANEMPSWFQQDSFLSDPRGGFGN